MIESNNEGWAQVEIGMHDAICVDWYIIPEYDAKDYGIQERVAIDFMVGARTPDDEPMTIRKTYNNTTWPTGSLMKALKSWKGGNPVDLETFAFDKLLGVKASIMVDDFSAESGGKISFIQTIKPPQKTNKLVKDNSLFRKVMAKVDGVWKLIPRDEAPAAIPAPAAQATVSTYTAAQNRIAAQPLPTPESIANPPAPAPAQKEVVDDVPF